MKTPTGTGLLAAIAATVEGVRAADLDAFRAALADLSKFDLEQAGNLSAAAIRSLLEEAHQDGLDADDVRDLITRCARAAAWYPDFDVDSVLLVLSGALGMVDPDQQPPATRAALATHAAFVLADLSTADLSTADPPATGLPSAEAPMLARHLDGALAEIRRAETMEMP